MINFMVPTQRRATHSRAHLDSRFKEIGSPQRFTPPIHGWIKAIRDSLGMSAKQLGVRLGITQPSVAALEKSEVKGTIELQTLRRVAEAMDCTVIYALVPNKRLETMVRDRARLTWSRMRTPIEHSMSLENQAVHAPLDDDLLDEYVRSVNPRRLWDEP